MKARVYASFWDEELAKDFGKQGAAIDLPDDAEAFLRATAVKHGPFHVRLPQDDGAWTISFDNAYE